MKNITAIKILHENANEIILKFLFLEALANI